MLFVPICSQAQINGLVQGKLPNGLTYYILRDPSNAGEVNFYLYQNVGAILETNKQYGLAHFLEHMAFNATEHFPHGVMTYLRDHSLVFNAQTGINETRFQVNNVPVADSEVTASMMLLLKDWCNGIKILPKDVEKEANIISEEWRQSRNVNKRLTEAIAPYIYNHSDYATHNVIGSEKQIRSYTAKDIKTFYQQWYRPELQCVAIIGDIEPTEYEKEVKRIFGAIPASKKPITRENAIVPENDTPLYYRFIDKENTSNSVGIYQRNLAITDPTKRDVVGDQLKARLFQRLASQELAMLRNDAKEEFITATVSYSPLVRQYDQNAWDFVPYAGKEQAALKQILAIRERIYRQGFDSEEFEQAKEALYNEMKPLMESDNLGTPDNWMDVFKQNYLYGMPLESFHQQIRRSVESLVDMEVEDLNAWVRSWMNDKNLSFITYSANPSDMNVPLAQFQKILAEVKEDPVLAFDKPASISQLIDYKITPGKINKSTLIKDMNVTEWTLSNGAKVLYKYLPDARKTIYFVGSAMGGNSLVTSKDLPSEKAMQSLIMQSGLYKYSRNQLYEWLQNKDIQLSLSINDYTDGVGGNTTVAHAEDFFQYLHLVLTKQNFNPAVFNKFVEKSKYLYSNRSKTGMSAVQDSINTILYPPSEDNPREDLAFYNRMRLQDLPRLFNDRFGNAAYFTFCLVGALPEQEARQIIEKYVASLPGTPGVAPRQYKLKNISSPKREITCELEADLEGDLGEIELSFSNNKPLSAKEQTALNVVKDLVQARLFDELREKEGGVYSIAVDADYQQVPRFMEELKIHFTTEREKATRMKQRAYEILAEIRTNAFTEENFKKVYIPLVIEQEAQQKAERDTTESTEETDPMLWIAMLNAYVEGHKSNSKDAPEVINFRDITRKDVADVLDKLMEGAKKRDITVKSKQEQYSDF